jgi:hypothetical protein
MAQKSAQKPTDHSHSDMMLEIKEQHVHEVWSGHLRRATESYAAAVTEDDLLEKARTLFGVAADIVSLGRAGILEAEKERWANDRSDAGVGIMQALNMFSRTDTGLPGSKAASGASAERLET